MKADARKSRERTAAIGPRPIPEPERIPRPEDVDFPGSIALVVDASDVQRGIFRVREQVPVAGAGRMTLLYPKWLPGYHAPQAEISLFAGLELHADGERLPWERDLVEVFAFHVDVPAGVKTLEVSFQFVTPTAPEHGRVIVTPDMFSLQWNSVLLYPAGYFSRRIQVEASLQIPDGWSFGCALQASSVDGLIKFESVPLNVLVDSPVFAGRHYRRVELDDAVRLHIVADSPTQLEATPEQLAPHRALIVQADKLFGQRHFDHFDFLVALSDEVGKIGLEHHRSFEAVTTADYFTAWEKNAPKRDVMSHEYVHSWNGKYRRGADSWTPSFDRPIRNSLLWVYEGQTQYWENVLAARSGLWSKQQALDAIARTAAIYDNRPGRRWRSVSDTTRDPIITSRRPLPWVSWQRSEDYYAEGQLVWLDVDTRLRELSGETRSLDDFARIFFGGGRAGSEITQTYDLDDVTQVLNDLAPFDWKPFFHDKLESYTERAPLEGLTRGGYRLVYRDVQSDFASKLDTLDEVLNLRFSIGIAVAKGGELKEVMWESPAFEAGLTAGSQLLAVNGQAYDDEKLKQAVVAAREGAPLELLVKSRQHFRMVPITYRGGLRYPHLEPIPDARPRLDEILSAR